MRGGELASQQWLVVVVASALPIHGRLHFYHPHALPTHPLLRFRVPAMHRPMPPPSSISALRRRRPRPWRRQAHLQAVVLGGQGLGGKGLPVPPGQGGRQLERHRRSQAWRH